MAVKMRLQRKGRTKSPYYHIVVADARSPRDGKFIERLGFYNPMTKPATIEIDRDKAYNWLSNGAQPTETVRAILRFKGVLLKKHLMRGVKKGAFTPEEAEIKLAEWIGAKESKIAARVKETKEEIAAFHKAVSGGAKPAPVVEEAAPVAQEKPAAAAVEATAPGVEETAPVVEETASVADEQSEPVAEASPEVVEEAPVAEAPAIEETPAVEEAPVAEVPVEEAPETVVENSAPVAEEAPAAEEVEEAPAAEVASEESTEESTEENEEEKEA